MTVARPSRDTRNHVARRALRPETEVREGLPPFARVKILNKCVLCNLFFIYLWLNRRAIDRFRREFGPGQWRKGEDSVDGGA